MFAHTWYMAWAPKTCKCLQSVGFDWLRIVKNGDRTHASLHFFEFVWIFKTFQWPFNRFVLSNTYICIVKVFIHYLKAARAFIFYLIALVFFFRSDIRSMFELPSVNLSINWFLNVIWFTGLFTIRMINSFFIIFLFREQSYSKKFRVFL